MPHRILLTTLGSLGDLHPVLALGVELRRRGHSVVVATTPHYQQKVERYQLDFTPLRPAWDPTDPELIARFADLRTGPEVLFRQFILPHLADTYQDLTAAASGADLMIASELVFAAPLVAEKLNLPWASATLSPTSFFSAYDPSLLVNLPLAYTLRNAGPRINRAILQLAGAATRHWWQPVRDLRAQLGLPPGRNPIMYDKFSPHLVLALFSPCFAQGQPDWPPNTVHPGLVILNETNQLAAAPRSDLTRFLSYPDPPIVFALGSTAVYNPGDFYKVSAEAARRLGRRALLIGAPPMPPSHDILTVPYAPYSEVFPAAAVIVHQGGSGTVGQALRAGRPQLIVPYAWDQPDNAMRIQRLGAGLSLARGRYSINSATRALARLLQEPSFSVSARGLCDATHNDDGVRLACDIFEEKLLHAQVLTS